MLDAAERARRQRTASLLIAGILGLGLLAGPGVWLLTRSVVAGFVGIGAYCVVLMFIGVVVALVLGVRETASDVRKIPRDTSPQRRALINRNRLIAWGILMVGVLWASLARSSLPLIVALIVWGALTFGTRIVVGRSRVRSAGGGGPSTPAPPSS